MKQIVIFTLLLLTVFSCKPDKKKMLSRTWHAIKLENPEMDSFFVNSQVYIDTVGKGHDAATNIRLYGIANMDSMRVVLQGQYDSAKKMQADAVNSTVFDFKKNGIAVLTFSGVTDSSKWYFDSEGGLVMEDLYTGQTDKVKMEVLELSETILKLKFNENDASSTVTFQPEGK